MKFVIFVCFLALAVARPDKLPGKDNHIEILRDERHHNEDGSFSSDFASEDGISISHSGSRLQHMESKAVGSQGSVKFTFPTGEEYELTFVANEGGFQPQSSWIPVAPAFPHPIPPFVLEQIEKAAREDAEAAAQESRRRI